MKLLRKSLLLLLFSCFMLLGLKCMDVTVKAVEDTASVAYAKAMEPGWNLGNTFDSVDSWSDKSDPNWKDPGENTWGNPNVTKELIHSIKESGFKSIRMPFSCYTRLGAAPDYKIKQSYLDRYAEVVNWALDEGLYVIVDPCHFDVYACYKNIGSDDGSALKQYKAVWKQVADYFKDYSDKLCFEPLNEPDFSGTTTEKVKINSEANKVFYDIVRNSGGKNATRMLIFPNLATNAGIEESNGNLQSILSMNDKNIMATFHYYGYWPFSANIAGTTTFDETTRKHVDEAFDLMYNTFIKNGIGVICGEYGVLGTVGTTVEMGEYLKYMEYVASYGHEKGMAMVLWDAGDIVSRYNYTWDDIRRYDTLMASANGERSSYTESDMLFVKKGTKSLDISTKLTLNGNKLVSVSDGDKTLVEGQDYTCENGKITFKGKYINSIIGSNYGVNKTLTLKFSAGSDWKLDVIYYNTAISSDVTGDTTKGLVIPMKFNGAVLATMEAAYSNGSAAGPGNWTFYKEFKASFEPNYADGTITIKDAFFKECNDGEVNLKFHWRDGSVTEYKVTKSGSNVKGVAVNAAVVDEPEALLGDVNDDGVVNLMDYVALKLQLSKKYTQTYNAKNADLNQDGVVNVKDLLELRNLV